jgi:hypothetical protein
VSWDWGQAALTLLALLAAYMRFLSPRLSLLAGAEEILHFALAGSVAFLALGWWSGRSAALGMTALLSFAALEKVVQSLAPTRIYDPLDLLATLAGIVLPGWLGSVARAYTVSGRRIRS